MKSKILLVSVFFVCIIQPDYSFAQDKVVVIPLFSEAEGNATPSDVRRGKTFSSKVVGIGAVGTLVSDTCEGVVCGANATCQLGFCKCNAGYNDNAIPGTCEPNTCGADNHEIDVVTGSFYDFVANYEYLPKVEDNQNPNEEYIVPPTTYVNHFKVAIKALIQKDICGAEASANQADMKLFRFIDSNYTLDPAIFTNQYLCIMGKDEPDDVNHDPSFFRGLFCMRDYFETNTYTRNVHIAIPHPIHDGNTNLEGAEVFVNSGAKYFSLSTTHRCGSPADSLCTSAPGTSICGGSSYKISDMAHNSDSLFYHFATQIQDLDISYHLQIHGFAEDAWPNRVAITSLGSEDVKVNADRISRRFTDTLNSLIHQEDSDRRAISCNDASISDDVNNGDHLIKLCATTNTIGRYLNGVVNIGASCTNDGVSFAHSRFIHLEQTRWLRGQGSAATDNRFDLVTNTVQHVFPAALVLH